MLNQARERGTDAVETNCSKVILYRKYCYDGSLFLMWQHMYLYLPLNADWWTARAKTSLDQPHFVPPKAGSSPSFPGYGSRYS